MKKAHASAIVVVSLALLTALPAEAGGRRYNNYGGNNGNKNGWAAAAIGAVVGVGVGAGVSDQPKLLRSACAGISDQPKHLLRAAAGLSNCASTCL